MPPSAKGVTPLMKLKRRLCCAPLSIISPEFTRASNLSPLGDEPPTIPPFANAPLTDAAGYVHDVEDVYRSIWAKFVRAAGTT